MEAGTSAQSQHPSALPALSRLQFFSATVREKGSQGFASSQRLGPKPPPSLLSCLFSRAQCS